MAEREATVEERLAALENRGLGLDELPLRELKDFMENNLSLYATPAAGDRLEVGP